MIIYRLKLLVPILIYFIAKSIVLKASSVIEAVADLSIFSSPELKAHRLAYSIPMLRLLSSSLHHRLSVVVCC